MNKTLYDFSKSKEEEIDSTKHIEAEPPEAEPSNKSEKIDATPWVERHKPQKTDEIVGQDNAVADVQAYVKNFKKGQKALLLHGPPGTGKTVLAYALAFELDYELLEMNASDLRTKATVSEKIGHAVRQQSLLQKKGKIVLIDEVDGIYGTADRGGLLAIYEIIKESNYPVILTANDIWGKKMGTLRSKCKSVALKKVGIRDQAKLLAEISGKEKIDSDKDALHELARRADGDVRAAINDLQSLSFFGKITMGSLSTLASRDRRNEIFQTLLAIFKSSNPEFVMKSFWSSDKSPEEIFQWLAENITNEYERPDEVASAFDALSRADVFTGRIVHNQAWRLQRYASELMALGVSSAKHEKYKKFTRYMPPSILMKMGRSKITRAMRDQVAEKVGEACHCSKKRAIEQFPYLSIILEGGDLGFGADESAFLAQLE